MKAGIRIRWIFGYDYVIVTMAKGDDSPSTGTKASPRSCSSWGFLSMGNRLMYTKFLAIHKACGLRE